MTVVTKRGQDVEHRHVGTQLFAGLRALVCFDKAHTNHYPNSHMRAHNLLFAIVAICLGFSAAASSPLRVAVDATYPPMEFEGDDGQVTGFDVDFARAIGVELKRPVEFVVMNWDGILAGLNSGRYDLIISSMNITPDRSKQVNFVPYLDLAQVFVTRTGQGVKSEAELAGKIVAVQADTTSHELVQKMGTRVKIREIRAFKGATDCFSALKSKQADVIVIDEPVGLYYTKLSPKVFEVSGRAAASEPIGIAIRKKDSALFKDVEAAVKAIKASPEWVKISQKWFGRSL